MESLGICHLIDRFVKCINDRRYKRLCDITDSKTYDLYIRICSLICGYFFCNCGKKIASRQFQIIFIYCYHNIFSSSLCLRFSSEALLIFSFLHFFYKCFTDCVRACLAFEFSHHLTDKESEYFFFTAKKFCERSRVLIHDLL